MENCSAHSPLLPRETPCSGWHPVIFLYPVKYLGCVWLFLILALTGCRTFTAQVETDRDLNKYQRYFVKTNLNDNHGLDTMVANALKEHGKEVEQGPTTMMPQNAQVLVTFNDAWNWDFKYHMIAFSLTLTDARTEKPIAVADFTGPTSMMARPGEIIEKLVDKLFAATPTNAPGKLNGPGPAGRTGGGSGSEGGGRSKGKSS